MKKIFITFMVAVSLLTFNRCTSLDMEPVSSISDANYWKSSDQFKAFNTGLHSLLRLRSYNLVSQPKQIAEIQTGIICDTTANSHFYLLYLVKQQQS